MADQQNNSPDNRWPPASYPYQPRPVDQRPMPGAAPRPPAPPRAPTGRLQPRLSKPQALELARDLKRAVGLGSVLAFGIFAALIAGKLTSTNAASSSGTGTNVSNSSSFFGDDDRHGDDGGFFSQQNNGGSFGGFGGGGFQSGPVTGSSVS
jgi:hypothetical protein